MAEHVLDSSVLLAVLNGERGGDDAEQLIATALVSAVNHCEVISKLMEWDPTGGRVQEAQRTAIYEIADFDSDLAFAAGAMRRDTRSRGLSLGDRACLALAQREGLSVYTMDTGWAGLAVGVRIVVLR